MEDYKEDVEELSKTVAAQPDAKIKETKAAKRLFKSVNKMINKLDNVLVDLEKKQKQFQKDLEEAEKAEITDQKKEELLKIDDIINAIRKIKDVPDQSKLDQITNVLKKMDDDKDGSLKVEDVLKVNLENIFFVCV